jgi:hypothetical protein
MSFRDGLDKRRESSTAVFHRFRTGVKDRTTLHLFVEGYEDITFYSRAIADMKGLFGVESVVHMCFGKKHMDEVLEMFEQSPFRKHNVLFIRDSDFDRFLGRLPESDHLFVTCGYSVENYVCTESALERFIRTTFGVDPAEVDIPSSCSRHVARVEALFEWLAPFLGACIAAVGAGRQLDLNRFDIRPYYKALMKGGALPECLPEAEWLRCGLTAEDFTEASAELGRSYTAQDAMSWLRGKYLLECTATFLKAYQEELYAKHRRREISRFNRKAHPDFSSGAVFERLTSCATINVPLRTVLQKGLRVA